MKNVFLTILAVSVTTGLFGQKSFILSHQAKRAFVAVAAGASLPVGQFAGSSPTDGNAGMANTGISVNLSAGGRLLGPVGLMVRAEQHRNGLKTEAMLSDLYRAETDVWTAQADKWVMTTFMAGPYVQFPMGRFSVDARLLAGQAQATLPSTKMSGNFGNIDMGVETTGGQSTALALGGGVALRYRLGRCLSVQMTADYSRARFTFDDLNITAWSNSGRTESLNFSTDRNVGVVSASAGVVFLFGNDYRPF